MSKAARSHADFANMPEASNVVEDGRLPLCEIKPVDTLRAYRVVNEAGQPMEPCV